MNGKNMDESSWSQKNEMIKARIVVLMTNISRCII
jgi:hypothetical protein